MALTTKPRWDKYDAYVGNFRATLADDIDETHFNKVVAVGLDTNGNIVVGAGQTGVVGCIVVAVGADIHGNLVDGGVNCKAGDIQDVGVNGEITNFQPFDVAKINFGQDAPEAGTKYYGQSDGSVTTNSSGVLVGYTVEKDRLVVHVATAK